MAQRKTRFQEMVRQLRKSKAASFGLVLFLIIVFVSIFAPVFAPHDPDEVNLDFRLRPGFWSRDGLPGYFLGTDSLGRDLFSRLLYGGRVTLSIGLMALGFALVVGITMGIISGYFGGIADNIIMTVVDILFAFPTLLLALVVAGTLGRGIDKATLAIGIVYTPQMTRVMRGAILSVKETEYIEAQHAIGSSNLRIIFKHILPNSLPPIIIYSTLILASAILDASALGFLGVGAQPPSPEWGLILSVSRKYLVTGAWWAAAFPGIAILSVVISLNLLGDGLRDALDPRLRKGTKL